MYNPHKRHSAGLGSLLKDAAVLGRAAALAYKLEHKQPDTLRSPPSPRAKGVWTLSIGGTAAPRVDCLAPAPRGISLTELRDDPQPSDRRPSAS